MGDVTGESTSERAAGPSVEELYGEYGDMVYNLGCRLLGERAAAEDLVQEVFLRVHRGLPGFRGDASCKTWIYRIALNAATSVRQRWARKRRRRHRSLDERPAGTDGPTRGDALDDPGPGPERLARSAQIEQRVEAALEELGDEFRQAVVLRDIEGLSYAEIAKILGVAHGTVKSRIARGRSMLRDLLEDLR